MYQIETVNKAYTGCIAGVEIINGLGVTDDPMAVSYFERHGALVTPLAKPSKPSEAEEGGVGADDVDTLNAWPEGEPTEKWRTHELDAYAAAHNIDLTGASNKAEKVELIAQANA